MGRRLGYGGGHVSRVKCPLSDIAISHANWCNDLCNPLFVLTIMMLLLYEVHNILWTPFIKF